jgi:cytoskeleton protein RodZ
MNPQLLAPAEVQSSSSTSTTPMGEAKVGQSGTVPQLRFMVDKDSWLEVRDRDNKIIFSQRLTAGAEQAMDGHGPLSLNVGYAPGVRVFWHGEAVDLTPHTRGDVARLVLE